MSNIIYAGVGGTGPWDNGNYLKENGPETFVKKLAINWQYGAGKSYHRGPGAEGIGTNTLIVKQVIDDVLTMRKNMPDYKGIVLCGHSRGAASVIVAARRLMFMGIGVDVLVLFDPVNCTPSLESHFIPSNVRHVIKPMRHPSTWSRPTWGNCGAVWNPITTSCAWQFFKGTHGAMGGQEWLTANAQGYIHEFAEPMRTTVTLDADRIARADVWNYVYPKLTKICDGLVGASATAPSNGQPSAGNGSGSNGTSKANHTVVSGESLSLISGKYWKDVLLWPILYDANKSVVGPDPNKVHPGQKLTIPSIAAYNQSQLNDARARGRSWR